MSSRREVAPVLVIDTRGRFLLQQRDDHPGIFYPGRIGLFGGHREGGETFLQCAVREVGEELGLSIPAERFEALGSREGPDTEVSGGTLRLEVFVVRDVPAEALNVTEGSLFILDPGAVATVRHKLTPGAQFALELFAGR